MVLKKGQSLYLRPYEEGLVKCPVKVTRTSRETIGIFQLVKVECEKFLPRTPGLPSKFERCKFTWADKPQKEIPASMFNYDIRDPGVITGDPMNWLNKSPHAFEWDCPTKIFVAGKQLFPTKK